MENKYQKAQIYKIVDIGYNNCYIGSTIEKLSNRMSKHRVQYKLYKAGKKNKITLFDMFDEYGVENCKIELVERYPCDNVEELRKKEGNCIKETDCINRCVAGRKKHEWYLDNKEHHNLQCRKNYIDNKQSYLNKMKEYAIKKIKRLSVPEMQKSVYVIVGNKIPTGIYYDINNQSII